MTWVIENWYILILLAVLITYALCFIKNFLQKPTKVQIENIEEWLKWAVTIAEKELGSGTGQLKLRKVYDMAINNFPAIMYVVSFKQFSDWVDEALKWMDKQLEENKNIKSLVDGGVVNEQVEYL